jgi:hypothetical protein
MDWIFTSWILLRPWRISRRCLAQWKTPCERLLSGIFLAQFSDTH